MSGLCRGFQTLVAGRCEWLADRSTWNPSRRLPSVLVKPHGSFITGTPAVVRDRAMMSLIAIDYYYYIHIYIAPYAELQRC